MDRAPEPCGHVKVKHRVERHQAEREEKAAHDQESLIQAKKQNYQVAMGQSN